jgi:hypothetical protein
VCAALGLDKKCLRVLEYSRSGAIAQLVERFIRIEEVSGSSPLSSIFEHSKPARKGGLFVYVIGCRGRRAFDRGDRQ